MDYKDTLLLPATDFPMRANLPQNEPDRISSWYGKRDVYEKMKQKRKNATSSFSIHDGPPYANGHLHIGHALNKILKDIITKTHYYFGEDIRYVPGWDCHGLPIEQQVEKNLGDKKKTLSKTKIRELCRAYASEFVKIQSEEFKSLGIIGDFDNPYLTMKFEFEADIYRALCEIAKKGLLVERSKPVYWSWAARSALAEAEVEYEDKEDYSIYVAFKLGDEASAKLGVDKASAVIWTTTPWTLPANQAICLNPDETYVVTSEDLIFAKPLLENLVNIGITKGEIKKEFKAQILEGLNAINPLNDRDSKLLLAEHVSMDGGTGLVHTAPGHGEDDYYVCLRYGIEVIMPVDEEGKYDNTLKVKGLLKDPDELIGMHIFKANERILELLGDSLLNVSKFVHSYPFCWRTKKPVIYRATKQWFISMDDKKLDGKSLRSVARQELNNIKFYPAVGIKRIGTMIENRPDWCISRQRDWGVPIAFFRDKDTKEPIFDADVLSNVADIFEKKGADAWWDLSIAQLLPSDTKYNPEKLEKVMDILDVWFDSGSTWQAVLNSKRYDAGSYPSSMYLEGSDQHRGWFQSSLLVSTAVNSHAPYKSVLTHGFTVDHKGEKMSKSRGNVVAPQDVIKTYGVEILRLWVSLSDYSSDLKISDNILKQVSEQYRKIRNTIRFLLANVNDLDEINADFGLLDKWILGKAKRAFDEASACFQQYDFSKGFNILLNFLSADLSGIYLDVCKDRLYCDDKNSSTRRSAQSAMAIITRSLLPLLAPTLTYTVDEVMEYAPKIIKQDYTDGFDLINTPMEFDFKVEDELMLSSRQKFFEMIDSLKKDKKIKSTLELNLQTTSDQILSLDNKDISDFYMVSRVLPFDDTEALCEFGIDDNKFKIVLNKEHKCPRCWKFNASSEGDVCPRCKEVLASAN
ncbi:isoleucyl-tRNA synthetase [Campylobacter pinnipediorum subsp. caledonicus]|uniref:Isoleucine--tRNA ligase n=1 Tax=Campylobacter pinnipediorum subsp. caledonicus TaxID=1874362 RepID=A0A1S6U9W7_9BACT|nr:isoleucine--tRNA ligase [Campylobacter pinnipediorum]AQW86835.1 isoleucyl-tRNA synthetase [Campylobacter pinnipediorum subsp. caledonicus]AQW88490.1 isoleucyl-tRNA synthetase [Campylobacter pinnipediorum subsp. caledonicus]OPA71039.1 isoleucine--tRNA ligase [Campylobacter pinnipediorum subsp. caledonicus]